MILDFRFVILDWLAQASKTHLTLPTFSSSRHLVTSSLMGLVLAAAALQAAPFAIFPTDNRALVDNRPSAFYMYVDRTFEGETTKPWQGGQYGYTRNPSRVGDKIFYTRFHGGIDIAPTKRDRAGEPLDAVRSIADGKVVHVSDIVRDSSFGRYLVVEHIWGGSPYYALYAHLASADVHTGQRVKQGDKLGRLGYTGPGVNKERAHLHLEINLMHGQDFQRWFDSLNFSEANKHGIYNGMNFVGFDPAKFLLAASQSEDFDVADHIRKNNPPFFKVAIPRPRTPLALLKRYPWLATGDLSSAPAYVIAFTQAGLPVAIEPHATAVSTPRIVWARPTGGVSYAYLSRLLTGSASAPQLTKAGINRINLITGNTDEHR